MGSLTLFLPIVITYSWYKLDIIEPFKTVFRVCCRTKSSKTRLFWRGFI